MMTVELSAEVKRMIENKELSANASGYLCKQKGTFHARDNTIREYAYAIKPFETFYINKHGIDREQIIPDLLQKETDDIKQIMQSYIEFQSELGNAPKSVKHYASIIATYLGREHVKIDKGIMKEIQLPNGEETSRSAISMATARKIYDIMPRILQIVLLIELSSLIRPSAILRLKIGDVDFESKPTKISVSATLSKNRRAYESYITTEASEVLKSWIGDRINNKEDPIFPEHQDIKGGMSKLDGMFRYNMAAQLPELDGLIAGSKRHKINIYTFKDLGFTKITMKTKEIFAKNIKGDKLEPYLKITGDTAKELYLQCELDLTLANADSVRKNVESKITDLTTSTVAILKELDEYKQKYAKLEQESANLKQDIKKEIIEEMSLMEVSRLFIRKRKHQLSIKKNP